VARRKRKTRQRGVSIETTPGGLLRLRFRSGTPDGRLRRFAEATVLESTSENVAHLELAARQIAAELRAGKFNYLQWFPNGNRAADFLRPTSIPEAESTTPPPTIGDFYARWIARKHPPDVRASRVRDYRGHFTNYILPLLRDLPLSGLTLEHLEDLRAALRNRPVAEKTIRNVIGGSLRAMFRDARTAGLSVAFPFADLEWSRPIVQGPQPFTAAERDRLLKYFNAKAWKIGGFNVRRPHYPYYAFLFALFFTGMRPSELAALRIRCLNLVAGTLRVERSRHLGAEAAPKTDAARRTVRLTRRCAEVLAALIELKARPNDYVFKNVHDEPIKPENFYDLFRDAQRALEIPLRDLYATKDTYVSLALTSGVNLKWLSEQTGVHESTLLRHYGSFVHTTDTDQRELAKIDPDASSEGHAQDQFGHRLATEEPDEEFPLWKQTSPTGFEPVLPA
jgi:integrase